MLLLFSHIICIFFAVGLLGYLSEFSQVGFEYGAAILTALLAQVNRPLLGSFFWTTKATVVPKTISKPTPMGRNTIVASVPDQALSALDGVELEEECVESEKPLELHESCCATLAPKLAAAVEADLVDAEVVSTSPFTSYGCVACVCLSFIGLAAAYFFYNEIETAHQCAMYHRSLYVALLVDVVGLQSLSLVIIGCYRWMTSEEGVWAELHPYEGEVRALQSQ